MNVSIECIAAIEECASCAPGSRQHVNLCSCRCDLRKAVQLCSLLAIMHWLKRKASREPSLGVPTSPSDFGKAADAAVASSPGRTWQSRCALSSGLPGQLLTSSSAHLRSTA